VILYGFPVVDDFSPLTIAGDHAHALFALHAALSRSAHPDGLVAANAAIGAKIASAIIVFLMVSSCSKWIVIGTLLAKTSIVAKWLRFGAGRASTCVEPGAGICHKGTDRSGPSHHAGDAAMRAQVIDDLCHGVAHLHAGRWIEPARSAGLGETAAPVG